MSYRAKFHYPPETDQNIVGEDNNDEDKPPESDMEIVQEEAFYRPKSTLAVPLMIDNSDMEALSRALFNSNEMNLFEQTHETIFLDKETGEKTNASFTLINKLF